MSTRPARARQTRRPHPDSTSIDVAAIGIAQKVVRLRLLDRFAQKAMENNYFIKAAAFMEPAAKECGGIYERKAPERSMGVPPKDRAP